MTIGLACLCVHVGFTFASIPNNTYTAVSTYTDSFTYVYTYTYAYTCAFTSML